MSFLKQMTNLHWTYCVFEKQQIIKENHKMHQLRDPFILLSNVGRGIFPKVLWFLCHSLLLTLTSWEFWLKNAKIECYVNIWFVFSSLNSFGVQLCLTLTELCPFQAKNSNICSNCMKYLDFIQEMSGIIYTRIPTFCNSA